MMKKVLALLLLVPATVCLLHAMPVMAAPQSGAHEGLLTGPQPGKAIDIARAYVNKRTADGQHKGLLAAGKTLAADDISDLDLRDQYVSDLSGTTHIYWRQRVNGIEVHKGDISVHVAADGSVISMNSRAVAGAKAAANASEPVLSADDAVRAAALDVGLKVQGGLKTRQDIGGAARHVVFEAGDLSRKDIPAKLAYVPTGDGRLRLAWDIVIDEKSGQHWWHLLVDAATGKVIAKYDWVVNNADAYNVYPLPLQNPDDGPRSLVLNPADPLASPFGWHDTDGVAGPEFTDTRGNNVSAQDDTDANDTGGLHPTGGPTLVFDYPINLAAQPATYMSAAIVNLFYWNNICHDIHYLHGFDEVSGNFQVNNYGRGGAGGDPVEADAQDGSGMNNANFATPPDGQSGRMQMYLFNMTNPERDGDLESTIIVHEFGHGVSTRLVGGPSVVDGLFGIQSGGMGEGWSDWWGLVFTAKTNWLATNACPVGTYVLGQPLNGAGIRTFPYSTDMTIDPWTYGMLPLNTLGGEVHMVGEIWCSTLWELYWNLVTPEGFNPDLYTGTNGNNHVMDLIIEGLKLTPVDPTFLDARDAILQADQTMFGGRYRMKIWRAFAKRGMGLSAYDGGNHNSMAVREAFDLPNPLLLDRLAYRSDALVGISVDDTSPTNQVTVHWAVLMPGGAIRAEADLICYQVGTSTQFTNSLQLVSGVTAVHGDTLVVTYVDSSLVTNTVSAPIDDVPPVISNIHMTGVRGTAATINWRTDEPASSKVMVSTNLPIAGTPLQGPNGYSTNFVVVGGATQYLHAVTVNGLLPGMRYFVAVLSEDYAGNTNTAPTNLNSTVASDYALLPTRDEVVTYTNNMDGGTSGWTVYSVSGRCWEYGRPTYGPSAPHTGTNCWGTILNGKYVAREKAWVMSEPIHIYDNATLTFWTWYDLAYTLVPSLCGMQLIGLDIGFVEVYDGSGWFNLTPKATGLTGIPDHDCPTLPLNNNDAVCGKSGGWVPVSVDLSQFTNKTIQIRFRLDADAFFLDDATEAAGWYIDDVVVKHFKPVGPTIVGYTVDDNPALSGVNDGDGYPEGGETFYLNLKVFNTDPNNTFTNVVATVGSPDAGVTPSQTSVATVPYGTLRPGDTAFSGTNLIVHVESYVKTATFLHNMRADNGGPWSDVVRLDITPRETMVGTVTNIVGGAAIAGATVLGTALGYPDLQATTDASGVYHLNGCVPGVTYAVVAGLPGSFSFSDPKFRTGPAANVNFGLGKAYANPNPTNLTLTVSQERMAVTNVVLGNTGPGVSLPYHYTASFTYVGAASNWLTATPLVGAVAVGGSSNLMVTVSSVGLTAGNYDGAIVLDGNDISGFPVVIPVRMVVADAPILSIQAIDLVGGDGDQYAEPGETLNLDIWLVNNGGAAATAVNGTLTSLTNAATVVSPAAFWPLIPPFFTVAPAVPPTIQVGAVPDGTRLPFQLTVTDASGLTWVFNFELTVSVRHAISGQVTLCSGGAGLDGATVAAIGSQMQATATTAGGGFYTIYGLLPGQYTVRVIPPQPYDSPAAASVNASAGNVPNVDFCVDQWTMTVSPTNITASVDEGLETNRVLTIFNNGTTPGHVWLDVQLVDGISTGGVGQLSIPPVDWDSLTDEDRVPGELLVRYKDGTSMKARSAALQACGVTAVRDLRMLPAALTRTLAGVTMKQAAALLAQHPDVLYVQPNYISHPYALPDDALFPSMWEMRNVGQTGGTIGADIGAEKAWDTTVGSDNEVVAIVDTGIAIGHPDLVANIWNNPGEDWIAPGVPGNNGIDDDGNGYIDDYYGWDTAYNDNGVVPDPNPFISPDVISHGTHVAGTVGAVGNNGIGVVGVNWKVKLMAVKAADVWGSFSTASLVDAMAYCVSNHVKVSNHSYGGIFFSPLQWEAMGKASADGNIMVCAAGNSGENNDFFPHYPANFNHKNIVSVAATDLNDVLTTFSCYGDSTVDIAAPGLDILSTYALIVMGAPITYDYRTMSGTSMASPHVAGACGLLRSVAPWASSDIIRQALLDGARRNPILAGRTTATRQLDLPGAVKMLEAFWLKFSPTFTNIPGPGQARINVILNAGGHLQAGNYAANILVHQGLDSIVVPVALSVNPAPAVVFAGVTVSDVAPLGDGDGYAEPGETVDLFVSIRNEGSAILYSPTGTLSTAAANVTVLDGVTKWNSLSSDQTGLATKAARVQFGAAVASPVTFQLVVRDASGRTRVLSFSLPVAVKRSITGWVRNTAGQAVANARVEYWGKSGGEVLTDASGNYAVHGLANGTYKLRAIPAAYEKGGPLTATVAGANATANFTLRKPVVTFSKTQLDVAVQSGLYLDTPVQVRNTAADAFSYQVYKFPQRRIALMSDGQQLASLSPVLTAMGFDVTHYSSNFDYQVTYYGVVPTATFSSDDTVVFKYDMVIADVSGRNGEGRILTPEETDVYTRYLLRGGKLLFTGKNPLTRPDDHDLAALGGVTNLARSSSITNLAQVAQPAGSNVFVQLLSGESVAVAPTAYDVASVGTNGDTTVFVTAGNAAKLLKRITPEGGVCYIWTGNAVAAEWVKRGVWQDVLKNVLIAEMQKDVPWLTVMPSSGSLSGNSVTLTVRADSSPASGPLEIGFYGATVLVRGNYPGAEQQAIRVNFEVALPSLTAMSTVGVLDWQGHPLKGNGDGSSSVFELMWAGNDGKIDPPQADGSATGDDKVLVTYPGNMEFGRFGKGYEAFRDYGLFSEFFALRDISGTFAIRPTTLNKKVYVRAWDAATFGDSVAYGDSSLYTLSLAAHETHDFGRWIVNKTLGYPDATGNGPDFNHDTIPDGWCLRAGLDPRLPIGPLQSGGTPVSRFGVKGSGQNEFNSPARVFLSDKFVFVLDTENNAVKVWNRSSETFVRSYGVPGAGDGAFSRPFGMGKDPNANRFAVADTGNNRIQLFTFDAATGAITFERKFGARGTLAGQFNGPQGVAIGPLGDIHVADTGNHRIQVFSSTGAFEVQFGTLGSSPGMLNSPAGICVDVSGLIYVADTGNNRIQIFNGTGLFLWQFGSAGSGNGQFSRPTDIQIGIAGRMYVADSSNHRIQIFDSARNHVLSLGNGGSNPGEMLFPFGVAPVQNSSRLYVADTGNNRIQRLNAATDADQDGMDDGWEVLHGLNPTVNDALLDPDGDGLINIGEFRIGTDPQKKDTDGDGLTDFQEIWAFVTKPNASDTDGDGLNDFQEVMVTHTDPNSADTDSDGWNDWVEIQRGTDPMNPGSHPPYTLNDYDGDGLTDIGLFWPANGTWYLMLSRNSGLVTMPWGWVDTVPVPGDYDGDGKSDVAVYWPAGGRWYIVLSGSSQVYGGANGVAWGWSDAVAVPGDYDGDGKTDIAVYWPTGGRWYIILSRTGQVYGGANGVAWGWKDAIAVPADYDGDGKTDIAVYWPAAGRWYIIQSSNGQVMGGANGVTWGWNGAIPVQGDYDGDQKADLAVYWPVTGTWYVLQSRTGQTMGGANGVRWGWSDAIAAPGDYDGDGRFDLAVFSPFDGRWYIVKSSTGTMYKDGAVSFGFYGANPLFRTKP